MHHFSSLLHVIKQRDAAGHLLVGAVSVALSCIAGWTILRSVEHATQDVRVSANSVCGADAERIVVIAIDDQTRAAHPPFSPINRLMLASVVQKLDKAGVSVIGLDIVFDQPTAEDPALADALKAAAAPVVLLAAPDNSAKQALCRGQTNNSGNVAPLIEAFANNSRIGHGVLCPRKLDDVVRDAPASSAETPSFSAQIAQAADDAAFNGMRGGAIPYCRGERRQWPFPTYSAALLDHAPDAWFTGKIALVGSIAPYGGDWFATPLRFSNLPLPAEPAAFMPEGRTPGVVIHAFSTLGLLNGTLRGGAGALFWFFGALAGAVAGLGLARAKWSVWATFAALAALIAAYWFAAFYAHAAFGWMVPITPTALAALFAVGGSIAHLGRAERRLRREIQTSFAHFLAPEVVNELARDPKRVATTSDEREVTALFTDLAGFTAMIDALPSAQVAPVLNAYLDCIVSCVVAHHGVVDKIVGDAVHALFSAPIVDADHKRHALEAALAIQRETERLREGFKSEGVALGATRIGVASGRALVGNFGGSKRLDFTAHGSTINIAARLEAENKVYGTRVLIAESAQLQAPDFAYRTVGAIALRGVGAPVKAYELLSPESAAAASAPAYAEALTLLETDPGESLARFERLRALYADDGLIAAQCDRARALVLSGTEPNASDG